MLTSTEFYGNWRAKIPNILREGANHSASKMPNNSAQFSPCSLLTAPPSGGQEIDCKMPSNYSQAMFHARIRWSLAVSITTLLAALAQAESPRPIPPPHNFRHDHYAYAEFERLLHEHASRAKVHRKLVEASVTPHDIVGKKQFLAIPPGMPPSERALILLERWPRATYAGLIDDVRVLACFDSHDRLVAYELF